MTLPASDYLIRRPRDFFLKTNSAQTFPTAASHAGAFLLDTTDDGACYYALGGTWHFVGRIGSLGGGRAYLSFNATGDGQVFDP